MSTYENYSERHMLAKSRRNVNNSHSASKVSAVPDSHSIGHVVGKLSERVDGIEVKMVSLSNVVKLLQKYTESKDEQYEKEKENL